MFIRRLPRSGGALSDLARFHATARLREFPRPERRFAVRRVWLHGMQRIFRGLRISTRNRRAATSRRRS